MDKRSATVSTYYPGDEQSCEAYKHWVTNWGHPVPNQTPEVQEKIRHILLALKNGPSKPEYQAFWFDGDAFHNGLVLVFSFFGLTNPHDFVEDLPKKGEHHYQFDIPKIKAELEITFPEWGSWLNKFDEHIEVGRAICERESIAIIEWKEGLWKSGVRIYSLIGPRLRPIPSAQGRTEWDKFTFFLSKNPVWLNKLDLWADDLARSSTLSMAVNLGYISDEDGGYLIRSNPFELGKEALAKLFQIDLKGKGQDSWDEFRLRKYPCILNPLIRRAVYIRNELKTREGMYTSPFSPARICESSSDLAVATLRVHIQQRALREDIATKLSSITGCMQQCLPEDLNHTFKSATQQAVSNGTPHLVKVVDFVHDCVTKLSDVIRPRSAELPATTIAGDGGRYLRLMSVNRGQYLFNDRDEDENGHQSIADESGKPPKPAEEALAAAYKEAEITGDWSGSYAALTISVGKDSENIDLGDCQSGESGERMTLPKATERDYQIWEEGVQQDLNSITQNKMDNLCHLSRAIHMAMKLERPERAASLDQVIFNPRITRAVREEKAARGEVEGVEFVKLGWPLFYDSLWSIGNLVQLNSALLPGTIGDNFLTHISLILAIASSSSNAVLYSMFIDILVDIYARDLTQSETWKSTADERKALHLLHAISQFGNACLLSIIAGARTQPSSRRYGENVIRWLRAFIYPEAGLLDIPAGESWEMPCYECRDGAGALGGLHTTRVFSSSAG
ncbi:uncharacterized protein I303_105032 [Kwoniella dejecticola CBS 10117]|uniref:Uncharacterized protein n=1 Tax=Kwoniella dejecticola CBS 10117 TaxID=1296121 RepID=A0A1A6A3N2_9TREE|nr:uncharacterized protein I303_05522 [Kwoniella dejecticola CBS 10117]OBR84663.1 hypothetical protein I303_05522 [Kwoniella dejecticola CBS 10117]